MNYSCIICPTDPSLTQTKPQKLSKTPSTPSSITSTSSSSFFPVSSSSSSSSSSPAPPPTGKQRKGYPKIKVARNRVQISSPVLVEMNNIGLSRAKSLEDLLGANSRETSPQRHGSPHSERKASPGRFPVLPPIPTNVSSVGKGKGSGDAENPKGSNAVKRKLAKVKSAGRLGGRKSSSDTPTVPHHVLTQSSSPPRDPSPEHRSVTHTTSSPSPSPLPPFLKNFNKHELSSPPRHLKTYVAVSNYKSSVSGSLSFQSGDKCVLLRKTPDGWWLVNIGGREGWTPEGYWKEEAWVRTTSLYILYPSYIMCISNGYSMIHMKTSLQHLDFLYSVIILTFMLRIIEAELCIQIFDSCILVNDWRNVWGGPANTLSSLKLSHINPITYCNVCLHTCMKTVVIKCLIMGITHGVL